MPSHRPVRTIIERLLAKFEHAQRLCALSGAARGTVARSPHALLDHLERTAPSPCIRHTDTKTIAAERVTNAIAAETVTENTNTKAAERVPQNLQICQHQLRLHHCLRAHASEPGDRNRDGADD